jgi:hypothetical protein
LVIPGPAVFISYFFFFLLITRRKTPRQISISMAEALAVIGSVGAICNIVDAISKVISLITDLTAKWENADLTLLGLASQLTALRAAITKIQEWTEQGLDDAHHQLLPRLVCLDRKVTRVTPEVQACLRKCRAREHTEDD